MWTLKQTNCHILWRNFTKFTAFEVKSSKVRVITRPNIVKKRQSNRHQWLPVEFFVVIGLCGDCRQLGSRQYSDSTSDNWFQWYYTASAVWSVYVVTLLSHHHQCTSRRTPSTTYTERKRVYRIAKWVFLWLCYMSRYTCIFTDNIRMCCDIRRCWILGYINIMWWRYV